MRKRHRLAGVIKQNKADLFLQIFAETHILTQFFGEPRYVDLRAEEKLRTVGSTVPEHDVQLVLQKACEGAVGVGANQLAEVDLADGELGRKRITRFLGRKNRALAFGWLGRWFVPVGRFFRI